MKIDRPWDEFWELSPAAVVFILEQHTEKKRVRGNASHLRGLAAQTAARKAALQAPSR